MKTIRKAPKDIDAYIAGFPPEVRARLDQIRAIVRKAAPGAEEAIKYQVPTYVLGENLVHFAAFKNHIGFYPTPSGMVEFEDELSSYVSAKGSVQFPYDKPLPLGLIKRMVAFRVKQAKAKTKAKGKN